MEGLSIDLKYVMCKTMTSISGSRHFGTQPVGTGQLASSPENMLDSSPPQAAKEVGRNTLTALAMMSTFAHHGFIYGAPVPFHYIADASKAHDGMHLPSCLPFLVLN